MTRTFLLLAFASSAAFAQGGATDPPVAGRPNDFSNIVGKYALKVSAEPLDVHVNDPITLHVHITGDGPGKYAPARKHLLILPEWKDDFYLENVPDEDRVLLKEKTWLFVYRLRPKHTNVKAIDGIKLVYFDPTYRGKNKFLIDDAPAIAIKVKPKLDPTAVTVDQLAAPDSLYHADEAGDVLTDSTPRMVSAFWVVLLLVAPPILCGVGVLLWQRTFPAERNQQSAFRRQAARRALENLQGDESPWTITRTYLHERFDFLPADPCPVEVAAFLRRRGFAKECCGRALAYFQEWDAVRFMQEPFDKQRLSAQASELIQALEADPCAR